MHNYNLLTPTNRIEELAEKKCSNSDLISILNRFLSEIIHFESRSKFGKILSNRLQEFNFKSTKTTQIAYL